MQRITRREFGRLAATTLPAASLALSAKGLLAQQKPNSRIHAVQIGMISSSLLGMTAADIIPSMLKIGLSEVELQAAHAEALAGAPVVNLGAGRGGAARGTPVSLNADGLVPRCANMQMVLSPTPGGGPAQVEAPRPPLTPEQEAAQEKLKEWRKTTTPETWKAVRKQFDDAGIEVRILWYGLGYVGPVPSDEDIEYGFSMGQGLGVRTMSGSSTITIAKRVAPVAEKYKMLWAGHTQDDIHNPEQFTTPDVYERLLAISPNFRICLDVGYFTAAGFDAVPFIQKNHKLITDIHLKDRKRSKSLGGDVTNNLLNNWPWGQGDSPIREVLQLLKKEKYDIPANIEYDYGCRTTSDPISEITRCYDYAKMSLA